MENGIKEEKIIGITSMCPINLCNRGLLNVYPLLESILSSHIQGEHTLDWGRMGVKPHCNLNACLSHQAEQYAEHKPSLSCLEKLGCQASSNM